MNGVVQGAGGGEEPTKKKKRQGKGKGGKANKAWHHSPLSNKFHFPCFVQVEPDTPIAKAMALVNRVLKDINSCRCRE